MCIYVFFIHHLNDMEVFIMSTLNKVQLIGRLGKDPELRYTQSNTAVTSFSFATSEGYKDNKGEWQDKTQWHNIVAWKKTAEFCDNYLSKGSFVYIEGKLQTRQYEDNQGINRYITEIVAIQVRPLEKLKKQNAQNPRQQQKSSYPQAEDLEPAFPSEACGMDNIPF